MGRFGPALPEDSRHAQPWPVAWPGSPAGAARSPSACCSRSALLALSAPPNSCTSRSDGYDDSLLLGLQRAGCTAATRRLRRAGGRRQCPHRPAGHLRVAANRRSPAPPALHSTTAGLARWQAARRLCPSAGIFGNSRAEIGFDHRHPRPLPPRGLSAFNHSIPGSAVAWRSAAPVWLAAGRHAAPKVALIGVGSTTSSARPKGRPLPPSTPRRSRRQGAHAGLVFFPSPACGIPPRPRPCSAPLRSHPHRARLQSAGQLHRRVDSRRILFRQRADENARSWGAAKWGIQPARGNPSTNGPRRPPRRHPRRSGGRSRLVIYLPPDPPDAVTQPRHLFNGWKRMVVAIAARHRAWRCGISAASARTLEAIPCPGDRQFSTSVPGKPGHFKRPGR